MAKSIYMTGKLEKFANMREIMQIDIFYVTMLFPFCPFLS